MNPNHPALIITGIAAVVVLAGIFAWCSARRRLMKSGGTSTLTLISLKLTVPAPPAPPVAAAAEERKPIWQES